MRLADPPRSVFYFPIVPFPPVHLPRALSAVLPQNLARQLQRAPYRPPHPRHLPAKTLPPLQHPLRLNPSPHPHHLSPMQTPKPRSHPHPHSHRLLSHLTLHHLSQHKAMLAALVRAHPGTVYRASSASAALWLVSALVCLRLHSAEAPFGLAVNGKMMNLLRKGWSVSHYHCVFMFARGQHACDILDHVC